MKKIKELIEIIYEKNYILFYISFLSLIYAKALGLYSGDKEYMIIMFVSMFFLGLKLLFTKYTKKEFIIIALLILYAAFIYIKTGYITFAISTVTLCGMKGIEPEKLLTKVLFIKIICIAVLVSASAFGIIENVVKDQYVDGLTYSFGHTNPNEFMVNVFMIVALIFYFNYEKLNVLHFGLSLYAFYSVYRTTNSTTGFLLGLFLLGVFLCLKLFDAWGRIGAWLKKTISFLIIPTSLICFIFTMLTSIFFDVNNKLWFTLDQLVTGRLKIQNTYWNKYGFSILGKDISEAAARYDGVQINNGILDNNYLCSFYKYGFVTVMLFIGVLMLASLYYYKKKNYNAVFIINVICVYGLMEDFLISSVVNPFLLFVGFACFNYIKEYGRKNKVKEEL